jgi:hypothetical protein
VDEDVIELSDKASEIRLLILLNSGMNQLVNHLLCGDSKIEFIPLINSVNIHFNACYVL